MEGSQSASAVEVCNDFASRSVKGQRGPKRAFGRYQVPSQLSHHGVPKDSSERLQYRQHNVQMRTMSHMIGTRVLPFVLSSIHPDDVLSRGEQGGGGDGIIQDGGSLGVRQVFQQLHQAHRQWCFP